MTRSYPLDLPSPEQLEGLRHVEGVGWLPRVTTVLKTLSSPALTTWRANQERELVISAARAAAAALPSAEPGPRWLKELWTQLAALRQARAQQPSAADLGTSAHRAIEWHCRRLMGQDPGPQPPILRDAMPAVVAWQAWAAAVDFKPLMVEEVVHCAEPGCGFAGAVDCVAEVDGATVLLDWKRARNCYPEYRLQASAYAHGLKATTGLMIDRAMIVVLPQQPTDGAVRTFDVLPAELAEHFDTFRHLLAVWGWRRALDERQSAAMTAARQTQPQPPPATPYASLVA